MALGGWRLIQDDGVSAAYGLAADEYLLGHSGGPHGAFDATLRLYTYRSHCALVGRFQDTAAEVRLPECERLGVQVNRRPTGGGAIMMGRDQLGVALTLRASWPNLPRRPGPLFQHLAQGVVEGLRSFGVAARFRPRNDIEVVGRKIAGLGVCRDGSGSLLFHASVLVDLDTALMLRLLAIPAEKLSDKLLRYVADRTTTLRRETGQVVTVEQARAAVAGAYASAFGVKLVPEPFTAAETADIQRLVETRYGTHEWVHQRRLDPADADARAESRAALVGACFGPRHGSVGQAVQKTPSGLMRVYAALAGQQTIKSVLITGDFFADPASVARLEARLKWSPATRAAIGAAAVAELAGADAAPLGPDDVGETIWRAVESARRRRSGA